eukprot:TRINITY_DN20856_c0_g1_i3.p1 TRINITY_DN20856_c0_g1~~TRINITY_DN20856_c0_g1_i3.p1  ORF type:complete len:464 (-),score=62.30 TRINITY_DN20856_c0_g1_i3:429-1820(-)
MTSPEEPAPVAGSSAAGAQYRATSDYPVAQRRASSQSTPRSLQEAWNLVHQEDYKNRLPPRGSLWMMYTLVLFVVGNMVIVIPTADQYAASLGADEFFSGLLIALTPIFSGLIGVPLNYWMMKRMTMQQVLFLMVFGSIVGNVVYALAGLLRSKWWLLISRAALGVCQFQLCGPTYISKTVGIARRSYIMFIYATFTAVAFAVGPLIAALLEQFVKITRIENLILDSDSMPGWFMACLFLGYLPLVFFVFQNPPEEPISETLPPQGEVKERWLTRGVLACYWVMYAGPVINTMNEVFAVKLSQKYWGWSVEASGYYMAAVMFVVIFVSLYVGKLTAVVEDRKGLAVTMVVGTLSGVLVYDLGYKSNTVWAVVFFIGLVLVQSAASIMRNYIYAMVSKLVVPEKKTEASMYMMIVLVLGRGTGSIIWAVLTPFSFGLFITAVFSVSLLVVGVNYQHMKQHEKAT